MPERPGRPTPSDAVARVDIRVIYGDTDQMGVVYYANYLRWFEAARAQYLRAAGRSYAELETEHELMLPVAEAHVRYRKPSHYDEVVTVEARMTELGWASLRFDYVISRGADLLAEGWTVHACIDRQGRVRRFPRAVIGLFGGSLP